MRVKSGMMERSGFVHKSMCMQTSHTLRMCSVLVREIDEMTVRNDKNDNNEQVKHELVNAN